MTTLDLARKHPRGSLGRWRCKAQWDLRSRCRYDTGRHYSVDVIEEGEMVQLLLPREHIFRPQSITDIRFS